MQCCTLLYMLHSVTHSPTNNLKIIRMCLYFLYQTISCVWMLRLQFHPLFLNSRAGHGYDLKPVMAEIYNLGTPHYYVVAVTKQRDNSSELIYLKRKNTCHTGVRMSYKDFRKLFLTVMVTKLIIAIADKLVHSIGWPCCWVDHPHGLVDIQRTCPRLRMWFGASCSRIL